jgi:heptosyltransferase III
VKKICRAAKRAKIPVRIATAGRTFTWFTCNRLLHIPRKNSNLHEAQLNLKMLKPLGITKSFSLEEIGGLYGLAEQLKIKNYELQEQGSVIRPSSLVTRHSIILHPKSKGSAREWGLENFSKLVDLLPAEKYDILVTGTADEGAMMQDFLHKHRERITDLTGKLSLTEFITLISRCDGLVAASTGPLHLAAALGIRAVGLYAPMRPIFPQRWAPIGKNAAYLVIDKTCNDCRKSMDCACIRGITPESVAEKLLETRH